MPTINGDSGNDYLEGTVGADIINGLEGADTIVALGGNDTLSGCDGDDQQFGSDGESQFPYGGPYECDFHNVFINVALPTSRRRTDVPIRIIALMLAAAACTDGGDAGAMSRPAEQPWCRVSGAGQLPAEVGGADVLCAALARALEPVSPKPSAVEVKVVSRYLVSVSVTLASGRLLPEIKAGSSDAPLDPQAIQMLADAVAARVAREN